MNKINLLNGKVVEFTLNNPPLIIELIPRTSFYNNVRSEVDKNVWDKIRKKCYVLAEHKCEICGNTGKNQGFKHNVECHEKWDYNIKTKQQTLCGFIALCPLCHKTKHYGLAQLNGETDIVHKQLKKVNLMDDNDIKVFVEKHIKLWNQRNNIDWNIDIDYINEYLK